VARPAAKAAVAPILARQIPFDLIAVLSPVLFGGGLLLAWLGWPSSGFASFLLGLIAGQLAQRFADSAVRTSPILKWQGHLAGTVFALLVLMLAGFGYVTGEDWGVIILAMWLIMGLIGRREAATVSWQPRIGDHAAILLLSTAFDQPVAGLALCVAWHVGAELLIQWRTRALVSP
jgi:hypothetical protein